MSEERDARLVPVELVEDPCGDDKGGSEDLFPKIDYDEFVEFLKVWGNVSAKWLSMHFGVPESQIQKFCAHHWQGATFAEVKNFLRGYTEIWVSKYQMDQIQKGNSGMMMFWGQAHLGQGKNARAEEQEIKPIPLAYVPKSQRNKEQK